MNSKKVRRILISLFFLFSIWIVWTAWAGFVATLQTRRIMSRGREGTTGEDVWGIGQIGALFSWAPLLLEMACSAVRKSKRQSEDSCQRCKCISASGCAESQSTTMRTGDQIFWLVPLRKFWPIRAMAQRPIWFILSFFYPLNRCQEACQTPLKPYFETPKRTPC